MQRKCRISLTSELSKSCQALSEGASSEDVDLLTQNSTSATPTRRSQRLRTPQKSSALSKYRNAFVGGTSSEDVDLVRQSSTAATPTRRSQRLRTPQKSSALSKSCHVTSEDVDLVRQSSTAATPTRRSQRLQSTQKAQTQRTPKKTQRQQTPEKGKRRLSSGDGVNDGTPQQKKRQRALFEAGSTEESDSSQGSVTTRSFYGGGSQKRNSYMGPLERSRLREKRQALGSADSTRKTPQKRPLSADNIKKTPQKRPLNADRSKKTPQKRALSADRTKRTPQKRPPIETEDRFDKAKGTVVLQERSNNKNRAPRRASSVSYRKTLVICGKNEENFTVGGTSNVTNTNTRSSLSSSKSKFKDSIIMPIRTQSTPNSSKKFFKHNSPGNRVHVIDKIQSSKTGFKLSFQPRKIRPGSTPKKSKSNQGTPNMKARESRVGTNKSVNSPGDTSQLSNCTSDGVQVNAESENKENCLSSKLFSETCGSESPANPPLTDSGHPIAEGTGGEDARTPSIFSTPSDKWSTMSVNSIALLPEVRPSPRVRESVILHSNSSSPASMETLSPSRSGSPRASPDVTPCSTPRGIDSSRQPSPCGTPRGIDKLSALDTPSQHGSAQPSPCVAPRGVGNLATSAGNSRNASAQSSPCLTPRAVVKLATFPGNSISASTHSSPCVTPRGVGKLASLAANSRSASPCVSAEDFLPTTPREEIKSRTEQLRTTHTPESRERFNSVAASNETVNKETVNIEIPPLPVATHVLTPSQSPKTADSSPRLFPIFTKVVSKKTSSTESLAGTPRSGASLTSLYLPSQAETNPETENVVLRRSPRKQATASAPTPASVSSTATATTAHPSPAPPRGASALWRKLRAKAERSELAQMTLDFGQRLQAVEACTVCGMTYTHGDITDEATHARFHSRIRSTLSFKGLKKERVAQHFEDGSRVVVVMPDEKQCMKKVDAVKKIVDEDLGFVVEQRAHNPNSKAFLFVSPEQKIIGFCLAELITKGYPVISEAEVQSAGSPTKRRRPWCCSDQPEPARCGINRVWVLGGERQRGVATKLLDCVRFNFVLGYPLGKHELAFSDPTPDGRQFAARYTGNPHFLVYKH